jgi:ACS family hexuronate transporter-like MFS transporter
MVALALSFLAGMSNSPLYPATSKAVMDWIPQKNRGLGMGIKQTGAMLAGVAAAALLPSIATAYSWRTGILVIVAMVLLTSLIFGTFYREKPGASGGRHGTQDGNVFAIFKDKSLIALTAWGVVLMALQFVVISHMALFLVQEVEISAVAAGGLVSVVLLASSVGRVVWGAISDAVLGGRHLIALVALGVAASIAAAATGFVTAETSFWVLTLLIIALGATAMGWIAIFTVVVAEVAGAEHSGTALGTVNTVLRIGMVSSPPLFGLLVDMSGSYTLAWGVAAGVAFISTAMLPIFASKRLATNG